MFSGLSIFALKKNDEVFWRKFKNLLGRLFPLAVYLIIIQVSHTRHGTE